MPERSVFQAMSRRHVIKVCETNDGLASPHHRRSRRRIELHHREGETRNEQAGAEVNHQIGDEEGDEASLHHGKTKAGDRDVYGRTDAAKAGG